METCRWDNKKSYPCLQVRMELFPERDGNGEISPANNKQFFNLSEWSSSLKGMETASIITSNRDAFNIVRMELFPERDGNFLFLLWCQKAMFLVRMELFPERDGNVLFPIILTFYRNKCPNGALPWKGWKLQRLFIDLVHEHSLVRMEVFPERDGNLTSRLTTWPVWLRSSNPITDVIRMLRLTI